MLGFNQGNIQDWIQNPLYKKMILCFHEIGKEVNKYCLSKKHFLKVIEDNPKAELHFDDGRKGIMALERFYLKDIAHRTTIFIVPNWIKAIEIPEHEKYSEFLGFEDIENLIKLGFEIGSHSLSHTNLTILPISRLKEELQFSKKWIEDRFKIEVKKFSYPFGNANPWVQIEAEKIYERCYTLGSIMGIQRKCVLSNAPIPTPLSKAG